MSSSNSQPLLSQPECQITTKTPSEQIKSDQESQQLMKNNTVNHEEKEMDEEIDNNDSHFQDEIYDEDDNSDSEEQSSSSNDCELMPRALPVNIDSDMDSNHSDYEGLQYLLNVRKEANRTSNVMIAKNVNTNIVQTQTDKKYIPQSIFQGEFKEHSELTQWEADQLSQFKSFKRHLEFVDQEVQNGRLISEVISNYYSGLEDDKYVKSKKWFVTNFNNTDFTKVVIPTTQTLHKITYVRLERLLEIIHQLVSEKLHELESIIHQHTLQTNINNPDNLTGNSTSAESSLPQSAGFLIMEDKLNLVFLNYYQFLWIYSLLGKLDMPILADISSSLATIMKLCLLQKKHYPQNKDDSQMVQGMTSILILIIREYYGQKYLQI